MIDVVGVAAAFVKLDEVADNRDEIFLGENRFVGGTIGVQALIDLVAPNASEIVSLRREEQSLERLLGRLAVRSVTGAQQRVDLLERLFLGVRRILGDGVLDQHRFGAARGHEDLDLVDFLLAQLPNERVGEGVTGLGDHFARIGIDSVDGNHATRRTLTALDGIDFVAEIDRRIRREDLDLGDVEAAETVVDLLCQLVAFLDEQLCLFAFEREAGLFRFELGGLRVVNGPRQTDVLGDDGAQDFLLVDAALALFDEVELTNGEEEAEDQRVGPVPKSAQQCGGGEFLLLVDVHVHDVMDVDGELDPRAAERDDARRDQALAVRVRRLLEHYARRAVQLADDHALGAVDDEGSERGEERKLTER